MPYDPQEGLPAGSPSVPTALVVDDSFAARARVMTLLHLGGWRAHPAVGTDGALRRPTLTRPARVVTEMVMRTGPGPPLRRRRREPAPPPRFRVAAARRNQQCRALASSAG